MCVPSEGGKSALMGRVTKGWHQVVRFPRVAFWYENKTIVFVVMGKHTPHTSVYMYMFGRPRDCSMQLAGILKTLSEGRTNGSRSPDFVRSAATPYKVDTRDEDKSTTTWTHSSRKRHFS